MRIARPFRLRPIGAAATVALLSALLILAMGAWQLARTRTETLAHAGIDLRVLSHALAQHAARTIETIDLMIQDVVDDASHTAPDTLQAGVKRHATQMRQIHDLAVVGPDGTWLADARATPGPISSADRAYFAWHRDHASAELHVDAAILSRTTGKLSIPLTRRINRPDGSFGGLVVATLSPEYFNEFYKEVKTGEQGTVAIWLDDGRLLLRYPAVAGPARAQGATAAMMADFFKAGSGLARMRSPFDGIERLFAFERVEGLPLMVATSVSIDEALAGWRHDSLAVAVVMGGAAWLFVLLAIGLEAHRRRITMLLAVSSAADVRYRLLADNSGDMISHMGLDGRRLFVSPAARELLGREPSELVGSAPLATMHPDDAPEVAEALAAMAAGAQDRFVKVYRLRHRDGHWVWVEAGFKLLRDDAGQPSSIVAATRNITDRQEALQALRESETRYRILAETTTDVITQLDTTLHRRYVSPACRHLFGYTPEEMLASRPSAQIHPDEAAAVRALAQRLLDGAVEGDRAVTTYRTRHKAGHWVWVETGLNLVRDPETGAPTSLICSLRDVTERQRAARHLERARAAAEAAGQAKADFVANMSHELRTPLTGILGVMDLLRRDPTLSDEQRRLVGLATDAGQSLLTIVNDVLDFSKVDAGQLVLERIPFSLDDLIASCRGLAAETLRQKPVTLRSAVPEGLPRRYFGDPTRLRQVLQNLLSNAAKFTAEGEIALSAAYEEVGGVLRIEVADTGIGLPAGGGDSLFERFSQADTSMTRRFGGTGLGLSICKRLLDLMGGRIGALPRPGGGSVFFFEVPLQVAPSQEADAALPATAQPQTVGSTILLAEDNATNAEIIAAMLGTQGYAVTVVPDGAAAVAAALGDTRPDIVLMDLQMPVMDGLAATAAIRAHERTAGGAPAHRRAHGQRAGRGRGALRGRRHGRTCGQARRLARSVPNGPPPAGRGGGPAGRMSPVPTGAMRVAEN